MIKGLLKGLCIAGLTLLPISFSSAVNYVELPGAYEDLGGNNNCTIKSDLSFDCSESNNVIVGTIQGSWLNMSSSYFWTSSGLAYYIYDDSRIYDNGQGYITSFSICSSSQFPNCRNQISYQDFLIYASNYELTNWEWYSSLTAPGWAGPVFIFGDTYISFLPITSNGNNIYEWHGTPYPYSFGLVGWGLGANYTMATNSPFYNNNPNIEVPVSNGLTGFSYVSLTGQDYVDYFESEYNFRKDMCYVGTKDLTGLYEDRVVYHQGTGYTIFDTYSKLFNTNSIKISELGTFLNMWKLNYGEWFVEQGNSFVAYYSGVGDYGFNRGGTLSNPFLGNRAVYFFIGGDFYDYNVNVINSDGNIHNLALYCYYKLNDKSNDGGEFNITDDHDKAVDEWVAVYSRNKRNSGYYFSGANEIVAQSWNGTPLDYFTGDENLDFGSFFGNSFNKFKDSFGQMNPSDFGVGFLPGYIILFLLAIIFFRFLSH